MFLFQRFSFWQINQSSLYCTKWNLKWNDKILSSFTHPHVVQSLHDFISFAQKKIFKSQWTSLRFKTTLTFIVQKTQRHFWKYLLLCSTEERKSYRFGTRWANDCQNFISWLNYLFNSEKIAPFSSFPNLTCVHHRQALNYYSWLKDYVQGW